MYRRPTIYVPPTRAVPTPNSQDFIISRPLETHWEAATCKTVDCPHFLNGWKTIVPTISAQADYIRHQSGRHFTEEQREDGMSEFVFPPGQKCFRDHRLPLDKQELYIHRSVMGSRVHARPTDWIEHFSEEMRKIERMREGG